MSDNVFYRLAPFIQEFIYRNNWTELRAIQVEACRVIFETDAHLLLSSGTAKVRVLKSKDLWYGVTYAEDKPRVKEAILKMVREGKYPEKL